MFAVAVKRYLRRGSKLGIASLVLILFAGVFVLTTMVAQRVTSQAIVQQLAATNPVEATLQITFDGSYRQTPEIRVRKAVAQALDVQRDSDVLHFVTFRALADVNGNIFQVIGLPSQFLISQSGAIPTKCTDTDCPTVVVRGNSEINFSSIHVISAGSIQDSLVLGLAALPDSTILVTTDIAGLENLTSLSPINRTRVWSKAITAQDVQVAGPESYLKHLSQKSDSLSLVSDRLVLHYPDQQIQSAIDQASGANSRITSAVMLLALLTLFAIIILGYWAQPATDQAATVIEQLTGKSTSLYRGIAILVAVMPVVAVATVLSFMHFSHWEYLWTFVVAAAILMFATLEFGLGKTTVAFLVTAIGLGVLLKAPHIGVAVLVGLVFFPIRYGIERFQTQPFELAAARAIDVKVVSVLVGVIMFVISGWISTISSLDQQQRNHIDYQSPLSHRFVGLQNGVLQEISLKAYEATGNAWPITKLAATSAGKGYVHHPIQIIGLPEKIPLPDQSIFGGPTKEQLAQITQSKSATDSLGIPGANTAVTVTSLPANCELGLWIIDSNGQSQRIDPKETISANNQIIGIEIYENSYELARREHAVNEGSHAEPAPQGMLAVDLGNGQTISQSINLSDGPVYIPVTKSQSKLSAIVSSSLAAVGDDLTVDIGGNAAVTIHVLGTVTRFSTAPQDFVIVDQNALNHYLAVSSPESIKTAEIWSQGSINQADQRLAKLQVWDREVLTKNYLHDPIRNVTRQTLFGLALGMTLSLLTLIAYTMKSLVTNLNVTEWVSRGEDSRTLSRQLNRIVLTNIAIMGTVGCIFGAIANTFLFTQKSTMWNGLPAVPPALPHLDWWLILGPAVGIILLASVVLRVSRSNHDNSN